MNVKEIKPLRQAYGEALVELGEKIPELVALDGDLAHATGSFQFLDKHPDRFFNAGIAEQNLMGMSAGLSLAGYIPFASTFALFGAGRAFEIIRNSVCYPKLNVKVAVTHAGLTVGEDGGSHQSVEDISLMRSIPNMTVIVPCDANETKKAVAAAAKFQGPVYLRISRFPAPVFTEENAEFEIGKANVLKDGKDVTIFATGLMVFHAMEAAEKLYAKGIDAAVVNVHTIKPIDKETVLSMAKKTKKVVTVEEHSIIGGLGSAVMETIGENADEYIKIKRMGINDIFGQSGTPEQLMEAYGLTSENIAKVCEDITK